jgi:hypothetical protein
MRSSRCIVLRASTPTPLIASLRSSKARFYRIALRSCTESAASLHTCQRRTLAPLDEVEDARKLLKRVVEMLTRLVRTVGQRDPAAFGTGTGTATGTGI